MTDKQIEQLLTNLRRNPNAEGKTPKRKRIVVREHNSRYYNGPAGRYMDPPTPMFIERDLTLEDVREALQ